MKLLVSILSTVVFTATIAGAEVPISVSPGNLLREVPITDHCPTFSWATVPNALAYDLAVYRVSTDAAAENEASSKPVLRLQLPGRVGTWTPSLDRCLSPGGRYAWVVRARTSFQGSEWSAPAFFRVVGSRQTAMNNHAELPERHEAKGAPSAHGSSPVSEKAPNKAESSTTSTTPEPAGPVAEFSVDGLGNASGASFSGDGSNLSNVTGNDVDCVNCIDLTEVAFAPALAVDLSSHAGNSAVHHSPTVNTDTLAELGCLNGQVAWRERGTWVCRDLEDPPANQACAPGLWVTGFSATGSVICGGGSPPSATVISDTGVWADSNDLAIGGDGLPVASFYRGSIASAKSLILVHCETPDCSIYTERTLHPSVDWAAGNTAVAIGEDNFPVVAFFDNNDIKVIHCTNVACSSWDAAETVLDESVINVDAYLDIAISPDGNPAISAFVFNHLDLILCDDASCTSETVQSIDSSAARIGLSSSLLFGGGDDLAIVAYEDDTNGEIEVAHCSNTACTTTTITTIGPGNSPSLRDGPTKPILAYNSGGIQIRNCQDDPCTTSTVHPVATGPASEVSLALGADLLPLVSYEISPDFRKTLHCGNSTCSSGSSISTTYQGSGHGVLEVPFDGLPVLSVGDTIIKCGRYDCAYP